MLIILQIHKKCDIRIYKLYRLNNEKFIFKILKALTQKIIFSNILIYSQINPHKYCKNSTIMVLNIWVKYMKKNANKLEKIITILLFIIIIVVEIYFNYEKENKTESIVNNKISHEILNIPEHSGEAYVEVNHNIPKFTTEDMNLTEYYYSNLENKKVRNGYDKN